MSDFFDATCAAVERPRQRGIESEEFWRKDDPILSADGGVLRGGMWGHQRQWWDLPNFIKALVGGYGSGKTLAGCKRLISLALQNAPCPVAAVSPSFPIARQTVITTVADLLTGKQSLYGRQFSWKYNSSVHQFRIRFHGRTAWILVYSGDKPLSLRGPNLAAAYIDEPFIQDKEVYEQMLARVRHPESKKREIILSGCVVRDTLVLPRDGMATIGSFDQAVPIKEYLPITAELVGLHNEFHQARAFFNNGVAPTRKITVRCGYQLEATLEHPVLVMSNQGVPQWRRTEDLKLGDYVAIGRGMDVWGDINPMKGVSEKLSQLKHHRHRLTPTDQMTEDLAYFLGLWIAEGNYDNCGGTHTIGITCGDEVNFLERRGVLGLRFKQTDELHHQVRSQELECVMQWLGMPLTTAPHKFLPAWVFRGTRKWALAFLAGMWDGDGHVCKDHGGIGYNTSSGRLARQVQCLLLNLGVVSSLSRVEMPPTKLCQVWSTGYVVQATGNNAAKLAWLLPLRFKRKLRALDLYKRGRDSDKVPGQAQLLVQAWNLRHSLRWREGASRLEPNKIIESARKSSGCVAYSTLRDFVARWRANETRIIKPILDIEQNLADGYYWAPITRLESSQAETVDFVVPNTHSFWTNGFISHNTPEQLNWGYDLCSGEDGSKQDVGVVFASTRANKALPNDYVGRLMGAFSAKAAEAYIEGRFINLSTGTVYYGFDRMVHVADLKLPDKPELGVGMDFNVNPMAATVFWRSGSHLHFFDEIELPNADTEYMASSLKEKYPNLNDVYPDATGSARKTSAPGGKSDFTYLRQAGFTICANNENPKRRDRYNAVNGKFRPRVGTPTLTVAPTCRKLIKYLSTYSHDLMNKQQAMSHLLDAFGYPISYLFPVDKQTLQAMRLTGV